MKKVIGIGHQDFEEIPLTGGNHDFGAVCRLFWVQ